jgi:spore germination cell wall hydrolase CwlJ-like protein
LDATLLVKSLIAILILLPLSALAIDDNQAVRAIVGESSNQGTNGMLAVACAIRNRGTLAGVMGLKAHHIKTEPRWVWARARRAWADSLKGDITGGATCWENERAFGKPYWARYMRRTVTIGDHVFYAPR